MRRRLIAAMLLWPPAVAGAGLLWPPAAAAATPLVTPLDRASPRLRFHHGAVAGNQPLIDPAVPPIPGKVSDWYVAQWQHRITLGASDAQVEPGGWRFTHPGADLRLDILPDAGGMGFRARLFQQDGTLTEGGGSNLFLATNVLPGDTDFARPVTLTMRVRILRAAIQADSPARRADGTVLAMAFAGLGLMFIDPHDGTRRFVFLQVPITGSATTPSGPGIICHLAGGMPQLLYASDTPDLPFRPEAAPRTLSTDLSRIVTTMIRHPYPCDGTKLDWPAAETDPANWHLTGAYVGLETENRDLRGAGHDHAARGHAALGLELDALSIDRD